MGAGFGAFLANLLHLRPKERRILLAAGMGSGIGAIFHAPLAGALFAAEVLYSSSDFEAEVIVPAGIASTISYCTYGLFFGFGPLFGSTPLSFSHSLQLAPYLILAVGMILLAMVYVRTFYACQQIFHRLPLPNLFKPAIGAFLNGCVGVALYFAFGRNEQALGVLSFGYGFLQDSLTRPESLGIPLLLAVAFGKIVTTSLTIGSGGSAGVFGASMVIGGSAGGALGLLFQQWWPQLVPQPAAFVVVGMAGFFAAAAKTPFSTLVMVAEMTGSYTLLLPALGVCMIAFLFADRRSIYGAQVDSRSRSPAHQGSFLHDVLETESVRRFLAPEAEIPMLRAEEPLSRVIDLLGRSPHSVVPVVDADHRLLGVVSLEELPAVVPDQSPSDSTAGQLMRRVAPLAVDDRLDRAVELFVENDLPALPVTDADGHVRGIVHRADVAGAYMKLVQQRE